MVVVAGFVDAAGFDEGRDQQQPDPAAAAASVSTGPLAGGGRRRRAAGSGMPGVAQQELVSAFGPVLAAPGRR